MSKFYNLLLKKHRLRCDSSNLHFMLTNVYQRCISPLSDSSEKTKRVFSHKKIAGDKNSFRGIVAYLRVSLIKELKSFVWKHSIHLSTEIQVNQYKYYPQRYVLTRTKDLPEKIIKSEQESNPHLPITGRLFYR